MKNPLQIGIKKGKIEIDHMGFTKYLICETPDAINHLHKEMGGLHAIILNGFKSAFAESLVKHLVGIAGTFAIAFVRDGNFVVRHVWIDIGFRRHGQTARRQLRSGTNLGNFRVQCDHLLCDNLFVRIHLGFGSNRICR